MQVSTNSGTSWTSLWMKSKGQGAGWKSATVDLSAFAGAGNVKVRFRADTGSNWLYTYMCLDALSVTGTLKPDVDADGLPNEWELLYFGGETNADPNATVSNGVNTVMDAYIAGINPTNPSSFFTVAAHETNGGFVVRWGDSITGRVYAVNWTTNLLNSFQPLETNIVWPQASYTDTVYSTQPEGFYKINVRLAE